MASHRAVRCRVAGVRDFVTEVTNPTAAPPVSFRVEGRARVTGQSKRFTLRAAARRAVLVGLVLAAPLVLACANLGAPPAQLGGFEPYRVRGRTYVPLKKWESYKEIGVASWYGGKFHGRTTANGERFDSRDSLTAAHRTLPFNVCAEVEDIRSGRSVMVRINDR